MSSEAESEWLFDYMAGVMRSPCWDVPVMTFIDEHCIVFDSEEENKFAYVVFCMKGFLLMPYQVSSNPLERIVSSLP